MIIISRSNLIASSIVVIDVYRSIRGGIRYSQVTEPDCHHTRRSSYRYGGGSTIRYAFLRGFRVMVRKS